MSRYPGLFYIHEFSNLNLQYTPSVPKIKAYFVSFDRAFDQQLVY